MKTVQTQNICEYFAESGIQKFNGDGKILMSYTDGTTETSAVKCISYADFNSSIKSIVQTPHVTCAGRINSLTKINTITTASSSDSIVSTLKLQRRDENDVYTEITTAEGVENFFNECYVNGTTIICSTAKEQFFVQYISSTWVLVAISSKASSTGTTMFGTPQVVTINIKYNSTAKTLSVPVNPSTFALVYAFDYYASIASFKNLYDGATSNFDTVKSLIAFKLYPQYSITIPNAATFVKYFKAIALDKNKYKLKDAETGKYLDVYYNTDGNIIFITIANDGISKTDSDCKITKEYVTFSYDTSSDTFAFVNKYTVS